MMEKSGKNEYTREIKVILESFYVNILEVSALKITIIFK